MEKNFIEINTDDIEPPKVGDGLNENREAVARMQNGDRAEVTIYVQAYNRLDKTKRCIESILENTKNVDYELLLVENGSTDGTLEYFRSIRHTKKRILHITKNTGSRLPGLYLTLSDIGKYLCVVANDIIVTPRWLENLLACMKSDPTIGMVVPVCNNVSNLQQVDLNYYDYEDMQHKAARFNESDPRKWEDRQRLITLGTLYRKSMLLALGWPVGDIGFFHDFADDDASFCIRHIGYRLVLAGDTWICHDHDFRHSEDKDPEVFRKSLETGRKNFMDKHFGLDAWGDVNNYLLPYLNHFPTPEKQTRFSILGVDTKCGTPILDLKNWLRKYGCFDTVLSAFTQDPKYWLDLKTICSGPVVCDREEFLTDSFLPESFDYVIVDNPVNRYHEPVKFLRDIFSICKPGGYVVCKLANAYSFREYLNILGQTDVYNPEFSVNIPEEQFQAALWKWGIVYRTIGIEENLNQDNRELLASVLPYGLSKQQRKSALSRMRRREVLYIVQKKK